MRRRGFVKALAAIPAAPALLAQPPATVPASPGASSAAPSEELPVLAPTVPDAAADPMPSFFTPAQFSTLRRVSDLLMPGTNGAPGAIDAKAPEFLDFLIAQSPSDRQHVYQAGLDELNLRATQRFQKPFADVDASQADMLLASLRKAWTFEDPADPVDAFLRVARQDIRTATVNSREYGAVASRNGGGGRRFGGGGLYWYPLD